MDLTNLQSNLVEWATLTNNFYISMAESDKVHDIAFYQQSPLLDITESPDVVVLGINPGSAGSFTDQKSDQKWIENGIGSRQHLLNGNPDWKNHDSWVFARNVKGLLRPTLGDSVNNNNKLVFTNATFFNTLKVNLLPPDVLPESLPYTVNLIQILNPKFVVALGGNDCFKLLKNKYKDFEYTSIFGTKLLLGQLNNITYVGIYHTSYHYFRELTILIQKALKIVYDNIGLTITDIKDILTKYCENEWNAVVTHKPNNNEKKERALEIKQILEKELNVEKSDLKKIYIYINDDIEAVFVAQSNDQCIYWRHIAYNGNVNYDNPAASYAHTSKIRMILEKHGYSLTPWHLGRKSLSKFDGYMIDSEDTASKIIEEITQIKAELNNVFSH